MIDALRASRSRWLARSDCNSDSCSLQRKEGENSQPMFMGSHCLVQHGATGNVTLVLEEGRQRETD